MTEERFKELSNIHSKITHVIGVINTLNELYSRVKGPDREVTYAASLKSMDGRLGDCYVALTVDELDAALRGMLELKTNLEAQFEKL